LIVQEGGQPIDAIAREVAYMVAARAVTGLAGDAVIDPARVHPRLGGVPLQDVFGYNDLIVDPRSFYHLNNIGYPVVFDVTHCVRKYGIPSSDAKGGAREFLPVLSRAGVASGVDGIFIETHPDPAKALCDAASQLCVYDLEEFLKPLIELHNVVRKY
jgi:hypothetical protein